ncbi:MAG TPA: hypothetical protein VNZ58_01435 [Thermomicrobiales bacterium]|nr:hypothetical protein [Thermomicrobiales bacterium]
MGTFRHKLIDPFIIPLVIIAIIWFALMGLGKLYLSVFTEGETVDRIDRPELWIGVGIVIGVIAFMAFLSSRPAGAVGPLDKDVAIGSRPFFGPQLPKVDALARSGQPGVISDISAGYTVYASNGQLGRVIDMLPGGSDYGKKFAGFIFAEGHRGSSDQLWIPVEAVSAVYPETKSVFLAVKGDETESFGWNTPPENLSRGEVKNMSAEEKVKDPTRFSRKY